MYNSEFYRKHCIYEPNRCYFSEDFIINNKNHDINKNDQSFEAIQIPYHQNYPHRMYSDKYSPILLNKLPIPIQQAKLEPAIRWKTFGTHMITSFPIQTLQPKVQLSFKSAPKQIPRQVEVERRLRYYNKENLETILENDGIDVSQLIPLNILKLLNLKSTKKYKNDVDRNGNVANEDDDDDDDEGNEIYNVNLSYLPLEWFDNFEFDSMLPENWLDTGRLETNNNNSKRYPLPGKAFLPTRIYFDLIENNLKMNNSDGPRLDILFKWEMVSVNNYTPNTFRWHVTDLSTKKSYQIPRIYLTFLAEEPTIFAKRIQHAIEQRISAEKHLKFGLILDFIPLTGIPQLHEKQMIRIFYLFTQTLKCRNYINCHSNLFDIYENEVQLEYQRTQSMMELKNTIRRYENEFSFISLPDDEHVEHNFSVSTSLNQLIDIKITNFPNKILEYKAITINCLPEIIIALDLVVKECLDVSEMNFFTEIKSPTTTLSEFITIQNELSTKTIKYIHGYWGQQIANLIRSSLYKIGKGWFDVNINDWFIYLKSKISRFMKLIKFLMENAIRNLVISSIELFSNLLCRPCQCLLWVNEEYEWNDDDLINSPFLPGVHHIFYMILNINETGPYYSVNPCDYESNILKLYDSPLWDSHFVQMIDGKVMQRLVYPDNLFLSSVGLMDNEIIVKPRDLIQFSIKKSIIPLNAYCRKYISYAEFYLLNPNEYIQNFKLANKSSQEYQDEITFHQKMKLNLELMLPLSIQIGPFLVNVEPLRTFLIKKRQDLANKLIIQLIDKLRTETQEYVDIYQDIIKNLAQNPTSIEYIHETLDYMEKVPDIVQEYEQQMKLKLFEFDVLDRFFVPLPDKEFNIKWAAIAGPMHCMKQIVATREMFEEKIQYFLKQQSADISDFNERIEGINMQVVMYSSQFDISKTTEYSIEIKKLWKIITETRLFGETLQARQILFKLPDFNLDAINSLQQSFEPYQRLWVTGAEFLKWKTAWIGNPLTSLVIEQIWESINNWQILIHECIELFQESRKLVEVAKYFDQEIIDFKPKLMVIGWLRNSDWQIFQWQELGKKSEMVIKYSATLNFDICLKQGIMNFFDLVKEISEAATENKDAFKAKQLEDERIRREAEEALAAFKNSRRGRKLD